MASEPEESGTVRVELGPDLEEWLQGRANALDVEPEAVLVQLLAAYRAAATHDDIGFEFDRDAVEALFRPTVETVVADAIAADDSEAVASIRSTVESHVEHLIAAELEESVAAQAADPAAPPERVDAIEAQLDDLRADVQAKIEDVRERVIQVKREVDAVAEGADGVGEERVGAIEDAVDSLRRAVADMERAPEPEATDAGDRLDDLEERVETIAWVVKDLKDANDEAADKSRSVDHLKRAAAAADVSRAKCENCGEGVEIGLLTEPACPQCQATLSGVEPASGFFGSPSLQTASQLESGEQA